MNVLAQRWAEANQHGLSRELARVRGHLLAHARRLGVTGLGGAEPDHAGAPSAADPAGCEPSMLRRLCEAFGLSGFERDVLLLCAGVELDSRLATLLAALLGDRQRCHPTFSLALAALPNAHWSALTPVAPLRRWRLVEAAGDSLTTGALRVDERILHYLTGISYIDEPLQGIMEPVHPSALLAPSQIKLAEQLALLWRRPAERGVAVQLCGELGSKIAIATAAADRLGLQLLGISARDIPQAPGERAALLRHAEREMVLSGSALILDCESLTPGEAQERSAMSFAAAIAGPLAVFCRTPLRFEGTPMSQLEIQPLNWSERRGLWRTALGSAAEKLNGELDALASHSLPSEQAIRAVRVSLESDAGICGAARELRAVFRSDARTIMSELAQRIEPSANWDDLILPGCELQTLREIAANVRQSHTVYETWGFAAKATRGLGLGVLFSGASGTGKTMAAEVLANELGLDLFQIDLSQVVSKYIGETEKNLRRIFDAADRARVILLFDEADALFGKRSEVKDSHDRYANIEVSYLLQRMEAYRGLAILTTNMKAALDPAFLRRLRFVVRFPFPDDGQRAQIWRRIFPAATPTEVLDFDLLARLKIPGGNIRGIALNAAFHAAEEGKPISMAHLRRAAEREYAKLEKALTASEIGGWQ
ncbi:SpoVK/Ycf46/Vps4 family AAA+-type ATPase [Bradyrhizobium sp. USDA 3397]